MRSSSPKIYIWVFVLYGLLLGSCNGTKVESYSGKCISIDIDAAKRVESKPFSSLFKNVGCIVLETTENSLLNRVDKIEFLGNYLYVLESGRGLFQFDMNGMFIRMIGDKGVGPGEYILPSDITTDPENEKIYLLDSQNQSVLKYDINGNFENAIKLENKKNVSSYIQYYDGELYTDLYSFDNTVNDCLLSRVELNTGKRISSYLNSSQYNKGWNELFFTEWGCFISSPNANPKYMHLFMDTMFELDNRKLKPYLILQSKNMVTREYLISQKEQGYDASKIYDGLRSAGMIYNVSNYFESNEYIHFKYSYNNQLFTVLYNKNMDSVDVVKYMMNDLLYSDRTDKMLASKFISYDKNRVYSIEMNSYLSKMYFLDNLKMNKINNKMDGADKLSMLTEESNPVIVYYEFQE